jgi:hypothetical protein
MTCRRTKFKNYVDEEAKRKNTTKSKVVLSDLAFRYPGLEGGEIFEDCLCCYFSWLAAISISSLVE